MFKLSKKQLTTILILCAIIILFQSVDVLMLGKDREMFRQFQSLSGENMTVDDYIAFHLMHFFRGILVPVVLALYSYFGRNKLRVNKLYKIIFAGLILISLMNTFVGHHFRTILFYATLIMEVILFFYIVNLTEEEQDGKL